MASAFSELLYAEPFAQAFADDPSFRAWVLGQTKFANRAATQVLRHEMQSLRTSSSAPWWRHHHRPKCKCFGCVGGRETDVFAVISAEDTSRFSLHIEVKYPGDSFKHNPYQAERYPIRAQCWIDDPYERVPPHTESATMLLCAEGSLSSFRPQLPYFETVITFEQIAPQFPHATHIV